MPPEPLRVLSASRELAEAPDEAASTATLLKAGESGIDAVIWRHSGSIFAPDALPLQFGSRCREAGLKLLIELDLSRFPMDHLLVQEHPDAFAIRRTGATNGPVDPRHPMPASGEALARLRDPHAVEVLTKPLSDKLRELTRDAAGFRLINADRLAPELVRRIKESLGDDGPTLIAGPCGGDYQSARTLAHAGISHLVTSFGWWDLRASWLVEEAEALRRSAALLAEIRPQQVAGADPRAIRRLLIAASGLADGIILPAELLTRAPEAVHEALSAVEVTTSYHGETRQLSGASSPVTALLRADASDVRQARAALLILINTSNAEQRVRTDTLGSAGADFTPLPGTDWVDDATLLGPSEVRLLKACRAEPVICHSPANGADAATAAMMPRLTVEEVSPSVAGGDFPVKRTVGDLVQVEATVFADGHEQLAVELLWRAADEKDWRRTRMEQLPNDRWTASFGLQRLGRYEFAVEGWLDRFGGYRRDFRKKLAAEVAQPVDHAEGRALVEAAMTGAEPTLQTQLQVMLDRLDAAPSPSESAEVLLSDELLELMNAADDRPHLLRSAPQRVDAERLQARFSSWYELFPRSITDRKERHGTFADVVGRLPAIRDMGFDTLYFPPIHPIGTTNRKGPNNSLEAGPDDVGSPYAIGSPDGGHDAIHPELGSFDDFARLVEAAHEHGLEIALDFAIQCSPDHPWLKEHPGWFAWRPDGSMKYAENPPKKYQDIVNVDFYGPDSVPDLWLALRDVVLLWVKHGVKTFRVDNPHTKPLPFWEWMIREVRSAHPEVIFLSEAFTRPTMMYRLAKIGFSQSYTYFTWRDHKQELMDYITELTTTAPKEFYRPHFFVNTPDINPHFLQTSGRPGFRIRAVLAATLSGLFGVYSGFELCEGEPLPGKEEYLDSEKYEIRPRDWQAPGNIIPDITLLNRLRRANPALQTHLNTRFYVAHNEQIIYYGKPAPDGSDMILVMVNLDPHHAHDADFEVPLWEFGLPDHGSIAVEDLAEGHRFTWSGKIQHIRLDPEQPYRIWRIAPGAAA